MRNTGYRVVMAPVLPGVLLVSGCAQTGSSARPDSAQPAETLEVRIGVQSIASALPFWVAEEQRIFEDVGLDVTIDVFSSGADRNTALTAGAVDCALGDPVSLALLEAGGFPVAATTVLLGATPEEGRQGIVAGPDSDAKTLADLAGVKVGTSFVTHQEYVVDRLFAQAGVPASDVVKEEVKKVPIRYELLMSGQLPAAALPEPWITLAGSSGGTVIAADTEGENLSQDDLIAGDEWLASEDGAETMRRILEAWDSAVELINEDPDMWRDTLVTHAGVPDEIHDVYEVDTYPKAQAPTREMIDPQVQWMVDAGYLEKTVPYEDIVWDLAP